MSIILNENFEGPGYTESWTENIEPGCILDPASAIPGTLPPGAGNYCLKAQNVSGADAEDSAQAICVKSDTNVNYVRAYLYIPTSGWVLADTQFLGTFMLRDSLSRLAAWIQFTQNQGLKVMRMAFFSGGASAFSNVYAISLDTWMRVEFLYDVSNMLWEFRVEGSTIDSGALTTPINTPAEMLLGIYDAGAGPITIYTDLVKWSSDGWIGEETLGALSENRRIVSRSKKRRLKP